VRLEIVVLWVKCCGLQSIVARAQPASFRPACPLSTHAAPFWLFCLPALSISQIGPSIPAPKPLQCTPCPSGGFCTQGTYQDCPSGTSSVLLGATACTPCGNGTISSAGGHRW